MLISSVCWSSRCAALASPGLDVVLNSQAIFIRSMRSTLFILTFSLVGYNTGVWEVPRGSKSLERSMHVSLLFIFWHIFSDQTPTCAATSLHWFFYTPVMSSSTDAPSKDMAPSPYHVLVVYLVEDNGAVGGGFQIKPMAFSGAVAVRSVSEFRAECYESLASVIDVLGNAPFDTTDLRESVVFDFVECVNVTEYDLAEKMEWAGDKFWKHTQSCSTVRCLTSSLPEREDSIAQLDNS